MKACGISTRSCRNPLLTLALVAAGVAVMALKCLILFRARK